MSQMFFGQYLLDEQVIGEDALAEAIAHAEETNARIGRLAVERGFMSQSDTHRIQLEQRETDLRFIDLAVDLGLLTREQGSVLHVGERTLPKSLDPVGIEDQASGVVAAPVYEGLLGYHDKADGFGNTEDVLDAELNLDAQAAIGAIKRAGSGKLRFTRRTTGVSMGGLHELWVDGVKRSLVHKRGEDLAADHFTKNLSVAPFLRHMQSLGLWFT